MPIALGREWLETNGLGGYASSSVVGAHTRRYHGLLVAATKPPVGRLVLLSKLEETLIVGDKRFDLGTNQYPGAVHPQGFMYFRGFRMDPFQVFSFEADGVTLEKTVFMPHGENTTVVEYRVAEGSAKAAAIRLEIRPLVAFRDFHSLTHENPALDRTLEQEDGLLSMQPYPGMPRMYLAHDAVSVETTGHWYKNFEYQAERDRGLDFQEDLFNPCVLHFDLDSSAGSATVIASLEPHWVEDAGELRAKESLRRAAVTGTPTRKGPGVEHARALSLLRMAADQFLVARGEQKTVIAGYHWFSDWGRDTMISLPGLTLCTGRFDIAKQILLTFADAVSEGMLPNRFSDYGEAPEYNTVDATLWYFHAIDQYARYSGDYEFALHRMYPALLDILEWHVGGTRHGIRVDTDGLLRAGAPGVQLTWMDARVGDWVVTPRHGKPVEIQALWYNALRILEYFAGRRQDTPAQQRFRAMADTARASFLRSFWNDETNCLYDVVTDQGPDAAIRPNQIFAVSLPYPLLEGEKAASVLRAVNLHLLTPVGLRSLSAMDPAYKGRYQGGIAERDGAYHQGTVWPWLIGPFLTAYVRVNGSTKKARSEAAEMLAPLLAELKDGGLGQLAEVYDGDEPRRPNGCIAQAWSVAEVLRALTEDVMDMRPASVQAVKAAKRT